MQCSSQQLQTNLGPALHIHVNVNAHCGTSSALMGRHAESIIQEDGKGVEAGKEVKKLLRQAVELCDASASDLGSSGETEWCARAVLALAMAQRHFLDVLKYAP